MNSSAVERSVVIPAHGREALTRACVAALEEQHLDSTEILVVEDGEPSGAADLNVRQIRRLEQSGFAAACNDGAAAANGRYLIFLNNDALPSSGWLDALVACAESHPRTAIVGAKLLWPDNTVQHAGVVFDAKKNGRHLYEGFHESHPAVNRPRRLQAVTAAAMLVRREAFEEVGGFDTGFVNGWEDIDLCLRIGAQGWEIRYTPDSVVYHLEGATRGREFEGDAPNYVAFMERWAERVQQDDLLHWSADGLLTVQHASGHAVLDVAPELGIARGADGLAERLARSSAHALELLRDNVRLAVSAEPPADAWQGVRRRRARRAAASVSVVVPVGHHDTLGKLLDALAGQAVKEVIVAAGGDLLEAELAALPPRDRAYELHAAPAPEAGGRAAAFNGAIERATGDLVLLLVDDFVPGPALLEEHLAVHAEHPRPEVAALGPGYFPPELRGSRFRRWLEDSGELFGWSFTTAGPPPPSFWYCANTSLKRSFLLEGRLFDERLVQEAWDDYELGLRLAERGMEVVYAPGAAAVHDHPLSLEERRRVMGNAGEAAAVFDSIYPRPHRFWSGTDPSESTLELAARAALLHARHRLLGREADLHGEYSARMRLAFIEGYRSVAWAAPTPRGRGGA